MAFHHGKAAEITVASTALSTYCDTADLNIDVDSAETTAFGSSWKSYIAGLAGAELELAGSFDPTTTTGPASKLTGLIAAAPFAVIYEPAGAAANQHRQFNAILTNYSESASIGDRVTFSATLLVTGAITFES